MREDKDVREGRGMVSRNDGVDAARSKSPCGLWCAPML